MRLGNGVDNLTPGMERSDAKAYRYLMERHGPLLARYIRRRITNLSDAEDVLQETLVAVWLGFRRLRDSDYAQAWLLQVAQNRCRDYFRAQGRRELPLSEEALHAYANRFGLRQHRMAGFVTDVLEAFEAVPSAVREAAQQFYLEGLTIAEIAADTQTPPGTVKRRLFQARHAALTMLCSSNPPLKTHKEKVSMADQDSITLRTSEGSVPAFPAIRPAIRITPSDEMPFRVDCQELRAWPIIPRVGEHASSADYECSSPDWQLSEVSVMEALRPATIHGVEGVEIKTRVWKPRTGWLRPGTVCARLTEDKAEYLAVHLPHEEFTQIETFLDDSFAWNWGTTQRELAIKAIFGVLLMVHCCCAKRPSVHRI